MQRRVGGVVSRVECNGTRGLECRAKGREVDEERACCRGELKERLTLPPCA